ncbi:MAG: hypothetical protein KatS3mg108_1329 [Isosphaeraceae bacterium]|nr:MAG: hypothetical protein KatS3mg108_1329 [Isosphaeraceae bacterium]
MNSLIPFRRIRLGLLIWSVLAAAGLPACSDNVDGNPGRGTVSVPRSKEEGTSSSARVDVKADEGGPAVEK